MHPGPFEGHFVSSLERVWTLISKYGFRAGLRDAFARWLRSKPGVQPDVLELYDCVLNQNQPEALTRVAPGPLKINWLLPNLRDRGIGGLSNIFRVIHQLECWGHSQRVYVVGSRRSDAWLTDFVREHYSAIKTEITVFRGEVDVSDALVATHWSSAYVARALGNTARKFYFVQDLEYLFYPAGSLCEFAKQTYTWGFYGITLGQWIADVLAKEFGMECS